MSMYSDYKVGALSDDDFRSLCAKENRRDRDYIDAWERLALEAEIEEEESEGFDEWE